MRKELYGAGDDRIRLRASERKAGEKFKGKTIKSVVHHKSRKHKGKVWETLIYTDGSASCDCLGWTEFSYRQCWHVEGRRPAFK